MKQIFAFASLAAATCFLVLALYFTMRSNELLDEAPNQQTEVDK